MEGRVLYLLPFRHAYCLVVYHLILQIFLSDLTGVCQHLVDPQIGRNLSHYFSRVVNVSFEQREICFDYFRVQLNAIKSCPPELQVAIVDRPQIGPYLFRNYHIIHVFTHSLSEYLLKLSL